MGWFVALLGALAAYALYVLGVRARRRHARWVHDMDDRGLCQWPTKLCYGHGGFFCWGCKKRLCVNHVHDNVFDDQLWCDWCFMAVDEIKYVPVHLHSEGALS
jgi:hypothetical protein